MADPRQISEDYISLDNIRDACFVVGKAIVWVLDELVSLVRRYWMLFAILIIMGTGIGILLRRITTNYTNLTMLVKFNDLGKSFYAEIIGSLNDLAVSGLTERLASELHLKEDDAGQIRELTLEKAGKEAPDDDTSKKTPFLITISLRSIPAADNIQSALVSYINNNPYLKKLKDSQAVYYRSQLAYLDGEIRKMDSLKTAYNQSFNTIRPSTIYYNAFNPADIYFRSGQIMDKKLRVLEWLGSEQDAMSIISSVKGIKVIRKHGINQILAGFAIGCCLAFILALWQDLRAKVKQQGQAA
jgi:hypothetical protein